MKKTFGRQTGRFAVGLLAALLTICLVAAAEKIPFLRKDVTAQQVMTPDARAKELIGAVEKEVDICYLADDDSADIWIEGLASKYADINGRISYRRLRPTDAEARAMVSQVGASSEENMLIVTSGDRSIAISVEELYEVQYNEAYYYYYGELVVESQKFTADERLVNGVLYVTADDLPVVYALSGHDETEISGQLLALLQEYNVRIETLNLSDSEAPEDAAALIIHTPLKDLTDEETQKLLSWLKNGGKLLLMTDYLTNETPNLETITAYYGMEAISGVVMESDTDYCYSSELPYYLIPDAQTHEINAALNENESRGLMSLCGAIKRNNIRRAGLNVTALQTTSDSSFLKANPTAITTYEQEENDLQGPLNIAMAAAEGDTRVVWYASGTFLSDTDLTASGGANAEILKGTLSWMTMLKENVAIEGKELASEKITLPTGKEPVIYAAAFAPALAALLAGVVCARRRKGKKPEANV